MIWENEYCNFSYYILRKTGRNILEEPSLNMLQYDKHKQNALGVKDPHCPILATIAQS